MRASTTPAFHIIPQDRGVGGGFTRAEAYFRSQSTDPFVPGQRRLCRGSEVKRQTINTPRFLSLAPRSRPVAAYDRHGLPLSTKGQVCLRPP